MITEEGLEHQKRKNMAVSKNMGKYNRFLFPGFLKSYMLVEDNTTLYDVVLIVYTGNI